MAHSLTTIGRHLECTIQTELIVELELALIERKQSHRFRHNSIIWQKDTKGFPLLGKVKGHRAKNRNTQSKDL